MPAAVIQNSTGLKACPVPIRWHSGLSIYASEAFLKTAGAEYGWLGGLDASGEMRCVLPYTIIHKPLIRMVRFRVETIPWTSDLGLDEEAAFLNSAVDYFASIGADMIIPASTNALFRTFPHGAVAAPYGSYVLDLTQPEEILWNNLHSKHRNVVRKAQKKGVQVHTGLQHLQTAYALITATLKRSRLGFMSLEKFQRLVAALGQNITIFVGDFQGTPQGCAVVPFSNYSAYYLYGGTAAEPVSGAMNLLQWEAIRHFRNLGVNRYDFVGVRINPEKGSKQDGLKMFKERFGGRLLQGYMWKVPIKPMKYKAYSLAVRLLRGGDIVDQERHKLNPAELACRSIPEARVA